MLCSSSEDEAYSLTKPGEDATKNRSPSRRAKVSFAHSPKLFELKVLFWFRTRCSFKIVTFEHNAKLLVHFLDFHKPYSILSSKKTCSNQNRKP